MPIKVASSGSADLLLFWSFFFSRFGKWKDERNFCQYLSIDNDNGTLMNRMITAAKITPSKAIKKMNTHSLGAKPKKATKAKTRNKAKTRRFSAL